MRAADFVLHLIYDIEGFTRQNSRRVSERRYLMKSLVAYFSRAGENYKNGNFEVLTIGNTKIAADKLKKITGSDIFEIVMEKPYSDRYMKCVKEAKEDLANGARPALTELPDDIDDYDVIYVCYPNYCNTVPMPVCTFLEAFDFTGKTIKPLCTHEGSGMGESVEDIKKVCPTANVAEGLPIRGSKVTECDEALKEWA